MDVAYIAVLVVGLVGASVFFVRFLNKADRMVNRTEDALARAVEKLNAEPTQNPIETQASNGEMLERLTHVERRMEMLEADAKGYLAKANTRMRRAEALAAGGDPEEEEEASDDEVQRALAELGTPTNPVPDEDSLQAIARRGKGIF